MARLSSSEVLNLILVLTNCQVVVAIFLGLAAAAELTELSVTKGRTAEKVARMVVVADCGCQKFGRSWFGIEEAILIIAFSC
jgi:hypothetical protein